MGGLPFFPSGVRNAGVPAAAARRRGVPGIAARLRVVLMAAALGCLPVAAAIAQAPSAVSGQGAGGRGSPYAAGSAGARPESAGRVGRAPAGGADAAEAKGTGFDEVAGTAGSWSLDARLVALALALAGAAGWLALQGRREARARGRRPGQGLPARRKLRAKSLRAQGALTALMAAKVGKLLFTGGGMVVSLVTYAVLWGWWYAAGVVMLLFVHELGHVAAARLRGVEVSAISFVPLMGAYVMRERTNDPDTEFQIAIGGPLLGTMAAFAALLWGGYAGSGLAFALAYTGFSLNLFNLAPVPVLDGGTATAALGSRVWLAGVPVLLAVVAVQATATARFEPLLLIVAVLGLPHAYEAWRSSAREPYHWFAGRLSPRNRTAYAAILFGLTCLLAVMMQNVHTMARAALGH